MTASPPGAFLLDVNVLVALFQPEHVHHEAAHDWFADHRHAGWATCPITENGFVRVVLNQQAHDVRLRPGVAIGHLRDFCASGDHQFWRDALSLQDEAIFDAGFLAGPRQLTDVYLLGLAHRRGGRLATFDRTIPLKAVVGASAERLHVIGEESS